MTIIESFQQELEQEAITTRKMLAIVPNEKYDWKPHHKSMTIRQLATHIAELPGWIGMAANTSELDFATMDYHPEPINDTTALLALLEKNLADARVQLSNITESQLEKMWTLREGEKIYSTEPKRDVIRMSFSQTIHHRAQLGVFLRLLDVPIPGSYGPSADEDFVAV